jgi:hypothetical protein
MGTFALKYKRTFATLGYDLKRRDRCAGSRIESAQKRLGVLVPKALRDYYLFAGCERRFNRVFNRLLGADDE